MNALTKMLIAAAVVLAAAVPAAPAMAANCRTVCCSDPDACMCYQVEIDGKWYGPCLF